MSVCRVYERPDGSVAVVHPAPSSRGVIEHPYERSVRVPASLSVEEHNAAVAEQVAEIIREHPDLEGAEFRLEVLARAVETPPAAQGIARPGSQPDPLLAVNLRVVFMTPEPEADWLDRVWARTVEAQPDLQGRPHRDIDPADLPPKVAPCTDGCGEEHPVRDRWRMNGNGSKRALAVDQSVRNLHADMRHLMQAEEHELDQDSPDGAALVTIRAVRDRLSANMTGQAPQPPRPELVATLTTPAIKARQGARA